MSKRCKTSNEAPGYLSSGTHSRLLNLDDSNCIILLILSFIHPLEKHPQFLCAVSKDLREVYESHNGGWHTVCKILGARCDRIGWISARQLFKDTARELYKDMFYREEEIVKLMENMDANQNLHNGVVLAAENMVLKARDIQEDGLYPKNIDTLKPKSPTPIHTYVMNNDNGITQRVFFSLVMTCEDEDGKLKLYGGVLSVYYESGIYTCSLCFAELPHIGSLDVYDHAPDTRSDFKQNDFESLSDEMEAVVLLCSFRMHLNKGNLRTIDMCYSPEENMPLEDDMPLEEEDDEEE